MATTLNLPSPHLSYSCLDLWRRDKAAFRRRYYEGIKEADTVYTFFGKELQGIIRNNPAYSHLVYPVSEKKLEVKIGGVSVLGYLDDFDPDTGAWREYKSGIRKPDGSPRWTQMDVERHDQLPMYSLLLQEKYGIKTNHTELIWFETEFADNDKKIGGVILGGKRELRLTGHYEIFPRRIYQYDRERMKKWIRTSAKEISEDYSLWLDKKT